MRELSEVFFLNLISEPTLWIKNDRILLTNSSFLNFMLEPSSKFHDQDLATITFLSEGSVLGFAEAVKKACSCSEVISEKVEFQFTGAIGRPSVVKQAHIHPHDGGVFVIFKETKEEEERLQWVTKFETVSQSRGGILEWDETRDDVFPYYMTTTSMMWCEKNLGRHQRYTHRWWKEIYGEKMFENWRVLLRKWRSWEKQSCVEPASTITANGTLWTIVTTTLIGFNPQNNNPIFCHSNIEATALKNLEASLLAEKAQLEVSKEETMRYSVLAKMNPLPTVMLTQIQDSTEFVFEWFNEATEMSTEFVGKKLSDVAKHDETVIIQERFSECLKTGKNQEFEVSKLFGFSNFQMTVCKIDEKRVVAIGKDMTELRKNERELERLVNERTAELAKALEVKTRFLAVMSHEMRTPLWGVLGTLSLLQDASLTEPQQDMVRTAFLCGEQLMAVINDVLDATKLEENKMTLEYAIFSPRDVVEDSLEIISFQAEKKSIELIADIDPAISNKLIGDSAKLRQILINLLGNAVKFSHAGDIIVSMTHRELPDEKIELEVKVQDHGIGISAEAQKNLFKPFIQADSSITRKYGGSGLGLSISMRLCNLMGGAIRCESDFGKGSTFIFTIPVSKYTAKSHSIFPQLRISASHESLKPKFAQVVVVKPNSRALNSFKKQLAQWPELCPAHFFPTLSELELAVSSGFVIEHNSVCFVSHVEYDKRPDWTSPFKKLYLIGRSRLPNDKHGGPDVIKRPVRSCSLRVLLFEIVETVNTISEEILNEIPLNILVAEDNLVNQRLLKQMLLKTPFKIQNISVVENGKLALDEVKQHKFDIVLMDLMMPEMDGLEASTKIRAEVLLENQPKIIAVTASAFDAERKKCIEAGMDDVVTKPIVRMQLITAIQTAIQQRLFAKKSSLTSLSSLISLP